MIKFKKKRNVFNTNKTKELKPEDGYNRFKFFGGILYYKEQEIEMYCISTKEVIRGKSQGFDGEGNRYTIEFVLCYPVKWKPINIEPINTVCL